MACASSGVSPSSSLRATPSPHSQPRRSSSSVRGAGIPAQAERTAATSASASVIDPRRPLPPWRRQQAPSAWSLASSRRRFGLLHLGVLDLVPVSLLTLLL